MVVHTSPMTEAFESDVERLYGLSLDEFTPARDETSRRLRDEGRREDAAAIKALRKPSNPAWVVNRLAREVPKIIEGLLDAGQRLRDTQLGGGGSLKDAVERERVALDRAMRNAEEIATHAGLASASTLQRVRETLHLAALDPDVAGDIRRGVLTREGRAAAFTGLDGFAAQAAPPKRETAKRKTTAKRRDTAREQRLAKAREKAAAAQRDLKDAERELADLDRALAVAVRRQEQTQARVERARARCASAQKQVAQLEAG
ncbi:MAG: hypothetical protein QOF08_1362 [Gaiellales bacterium]|jgi:hypothetical protein|nr:hypothetical protein [Gaiellales bacterium]